VRAQAATASGGRRNSYILIGNERDRPSMRAAVGRRFRYRLPSEFGAPKWALTRRLFVPWKIPEAVLLDQFVAFGRREVFLHHFPHQALERGFGLPTELQLCLGGIAEQGGDFRRSEVARVDRHDALAGCGVVTLLVCVATLPLHADPDLVCGD